MDTDTAQYDPQPATPEGGAGPLPPGVKFHPQFLPATPPMMVKCTICGADAVLGHDIHDHDDTKRVHHNIAYCPNCGQVVRPKMLA